MKPWVTKQTGFTIVELLIVVVVIAILAAITIVAYNGIQQRATNNQITAAARTYKQAFSLYVAQNGQLPPVSSGVSLNYCLNHSVATCVNAGAAPSWSRDSTSLEPALQTVTTPLPTINFSSSTYSSADSNMGYIPYRGGTTNPQLDGTNSAFLIYILEGYVDCPVGPVSGGAWPNYTTSNANRYTWRSGNITACWVPLASS